MHNAGVVVFPYDVLRYWVGWVAPGSPADRMGLREDDYLDRKVRGKRIPYETILNRIAERKSTRITRYSSGFEDKWVEYTLRGDGTKRLTSKVDKAALARETKRRDEEEKARWEREKNERMYVEVKGGWVRVEGARLREGPREGERFVTYEELVEIRRSSEEGR